ncbi:MAG: FkbM family methyltransferase [Anaerolineae bacterium]|nr:FkbM family methyltransferase [Anaerolineae bacterium]MDW8172012.1 FkbM family methyltransferase [Anaerolineae bacterium]
MINKVAQLITQRILNSPNRLEIRLLKRLRRSLLVFIDPLIHYDLRDQRVLLPFSHELPFILKVYPKYSSNIVTVASQVILKYPDAALVDIGANVGDTAILLRSEMQNPILCIEGSLEYFKMLEQNISRLDGVYAVNTFVIGSEKFEGVLVKQGGTASPTKTGQTGIHNQARLSEILREYPSLSDRVKVLKIDTDGYDICILEDQEEMLRRLKPVVLFEYVPKLFRQHSPNGKTVFKWLMGLGYRKIIFYDNFGSYLLTLDLSEGSISIVDDIDHYLSGQSVVPYCDIVVFHAEDEDLCTEIRRKELNVS